MPDTSLPPSLTPRPAPAGPEPARPRIGVVNAVGLLVVGALATFGLLVAGFVGALCGLGGSDTDCSDEHQLAWLALAGAAVVFLGVPALVAALRRDGRWLLVPVGEIALVALLIAASDAF